MGQHVRQIRVGKHDIGILGLIEAIESVAETHKDAPDDIISEALVEALKKRNYISGNTREKYKQAFLREYRKHMGLPVTEAGCDQDELVVTVVGPGCSRCENLEMMVMEALSELNLPARLDHIRDPKEIGRMGILGTPAVLINGEVRCVGSVPSKHQLMAWLASYQKKEE